MEAINYKQHFMVDLETLATTPDAHILETALVHFNPVTGDVYDLGTFHMRHGLDKQEGGVVDTATLDWWHETNRDYFSKLLNPAEKKPLVEALVYMQTQFEHARNNGGLLVWNTGTFDTDNLNNAFKRLVDPKTTLINFWEVRDCRSLRTISDMFPKLLRSVSAVTHNAYEDCIRQIEYITNVTKYLAEQE
jgi:exodeoxyribonuclease VIII|nr:MAG TPA: 3' exoribonuclease [Caudoviricetes sp.]